MISNVNGIVLWNNGDDPLQFAENNSVGFDIAFDQAVNQDQDHNIINY